VRLVRHLPANVGLPSWFGELAEFNETLRERFMVRPDDDAPIRISGIRVLRIVARHFGLNVETLAGDCRRAIYVRPRYIGYYLCVHVAGLSTPRTGALFGGRDHSTIVQGLKKIEARVAVSPDLANMIRDLTAQCREAAWL
jgi:chromosomal replication initiator protein